MTNAANDPREAAEQAVIAAADDYRRDWEKALYAGSAKGVDRRKAAARAKFRTAYRQAVIVELEAVSDDCGCWEDSTVDDEELCFLHARLAELRKAQ